MHDDDFDPKDLAPASIVLDRQRAAGRSARSKRGPKFIRVPIVWADRLAASRHLSTSAVAHRLLDRSFREHRRTIRLANVGLESIGVTPRQKWRALAELENLGLIRVDRHLRKSPDITLLYLEA
jgi:hypothetical protein